MKLDAVMTREDLKSTCDRLAFDPPRAEFDPHDVPENLREFVPYAEIWGHNSNDIRFGVVDATPRLLKQHLPEVIFKPEVQDRFDEWLAGPEAARPKLTPAYLAFTCLRIAAEEMEARLASGRG